MSRKRAKTLTDKQLIKLFEHIDEQSFFPERDKLIMTLSFKAGLRAVEISKMNLTDMLDAEGKVSDTISISPKVAKFNRARDMPMHPAIRRALKEFMKAFPSAEFVAISHKKYYWALKRGETIPPDAEFERMTPQAVCHLYKRLMDGVGFEGASSHSGRRTFGTQAARKANKHGCSLRDVQMLLGHSRLDTTENYIDLSDDAHKLVAAI